MQASPHRRSSNPIPLRTHRNLSHQTPTHHPNNKICSQSSTFFSMPRGQPSGLFFECGSKAPAFTHLTPPPVPSTSAPTPKFVILPARLRREPAPYAGEGPQLKPLHKIHQRVPIAFFLCFFASSLPSLFTSLPSSLILLIHDSH